MNTSESARLFAEAQQLIPGGVNSPVRAFRGVGGTPRFIASGSGAWMTDVDGNRYLDYVLLLGAADPGPRPPRRRRRADARRCNAARATARRPRSRASWPS